MLTVSSISTQSLSVVLKGASLISQGQHPSRDAIVNMEKWWLCGFPFSLLLRAATITHIDWQRCSSERRHSSSHRFGEKVKVSYKKNLLKICRDSVLWDSDETTHRAASSHSSLWKHRNIPIMNTCCYRRSWKNQWQDSEVRRGLTRIRAHTAAF